jgi:hypothetical protein
VRPTLISSRLSKWSGHQPRKSDFGRVSHVRYDGDAQRDIGEVNGGARQGGTRCDEATSDNGQRLGTDRGWNPACGADHAEERQHEHHGRHLEQASRDHKQADHDEHDQDCQQKHGASTSTFCGGTVSRCTSLPPAARSQTVFGALEGYPRNDHTATQLAR